MCSDHINGDSCCHLGKWKGIGMDRANGVGMLLCPNRVIWPGVMLLLLLNATGCNERLKRMESNQVVLEEKIDQNSRQVMVLARKMDMSQAALEVRIERVQAGYDVALAETRATRYEQEKLREDTRQFSRKWTAGIMRVEEHQRHLQASVNGVAGTATVIDEGVQKLDTGQGAVRVLMAANQTETRAGLVQLRAGQSDAETAASEAVAALKRGQNGIAALTSEGVAATDRVSNQVADVQVSQNEQTGIVREHHKVLIAKVDGVSEDQKRFQRLTSRQVHQLSKKVTTGQVDQKKANALQDAMMADRADAIDAGLRATQENQKDLAVQLKGHHEYAMELGTHVTAVEEEQKRVNDSIQQGNRTVDLAVQAVGLNQKKFERTLKSVESTAVATHKQTGTIADKQSEFHTLEGQRHDSVIQAAAGLETSQNQAQGTLNQIAATAQGIVRDTGAIRNQQSQLDESLQLEGAHIRQGLSQLEKNQGQLQESVNSVQATTNTIAEMAAANARETQTIQDQQAALQQGMAQRGGQISQALANMDENQDRINRAVNNVQVTTSTAASNTTTLMEQQPTLQRVARQNQAQLVESVDRLGANQKVLSQQAETLKTGQGQMRKMLIRSANAVSGQQGELQDSLDGVAATTKAISQDTRDLKQGQAALKTDMQSGHGEISKDLGLVGQSQVSLNRMFISGKTDLDAELQSIGKNQAGLQNGLSDQRDMSQDMAKQIKLMKQDQANMSQTMDQQQQAWEDQRGDLAKRVAALEDSLGHVDQNVSSLQTNLVAQITELTKVMKALQVQGGAQIAQLTDDMKAFNGTLKQIQATQANLARRIDQVGVNQAQQSSGFLTALEKLQPQTQPISTSKPVEEASQDVDIVK